MSTQSDSNSDIEMKRIPLKKEKQKKIPRSPTADILKEPKKLTTREMVNNALEELKSRKGVSYQAIKKYLVEKYQVDTERTNFYIKKYLKTAVESGVIIQIKGVGASGSFRLAAAKKKTVERPEKKVKTKDKSKKTNKIDKIKDKEKKSKVNGDRDIIKKKTVIKSKTDQPKSKKLKMNNDATEKIKKQQMKMATKPKKDNKTTKLKGTQTPAKKKTTMIKRKSIGTIIKPPKMKPKAK